MSGKELNKPKAAYNWISESNVYSSGCKSEDSMSQSDHKSEKSYSTVSNDDITESDVGQLMNKLFLKELFSDIKFISKNGNDSVSAHSPVLAAKCQMFADLLFGDNVNEAKVKERTITISNLDFSAFKKMIEYLYTGDIVFTDVSTALGIYIAAKKYNIGCLVECCESYIEFLELTENNVCSIFQMCKDEILEDLKNRCIIYIQENTEKVISSTDFEKCSYEAIRTICNLPSLGLKSEKQILEAIVRWIHTEPSHMRDQLIKALLPSIRFLTFTATELGSILQKYSGFLSADDALKIMIFLNESPQKRNIENLPSWCSTNMERRCTGHKSEAKEKHKIRKDVNGKILVSLKPSDVSDEMLKFSSLLTMLCMKGSHQINAIKMSFQDIPLYEKIIIYISVEVLHFQTLLRFRKLTFVISSKEKAIYFKTPIKVFPGQVVRFETEAVSRISLNLFKLDNNQHLLQDEHFKCNVESKPEDKTLYFISEVQYGPLRKAKNKEGHTNQ